MRGNIPATYPKRTWLVKFCRPTFRKAANTTPKETQHTVKLHGYWTKWFLKHYTMACHTIITSGNHFSAENKQEAAEYDSQHLPMHFRGIIWKIKSKSNFPVSFSCGLINADMNLVGNYRTLRGLRTVNPERLPSTSVNMVGLSFGRLTQLSSSLVNKAREAIRTSEHRWELSWSPGQVGQWSHDVSQTTRSPDHCAGVGGSC